MLKVKLLGIKIDPLSKLQCEEKLEEFLQFDRPSLIFTPNPEFLVKASGDKDFEKILNNASLNVPDGIGLRWAAKFLSIKTPNNQFLYFPAIIIQWLATLLLLPIAPKYFSEPIPERVSGSDFIWSLSRFAAKNKLRIFLLGGAPTVAERCALKLQTDIYNLRVAGVHSGRAEDVNDIVESIRKSKADILMVAFGAPKQEKWLAENIGKTGCKIGIGLGGTFDFIAGIRRRAPRWVQKIGFEWLYRLIQEPSRIKRQLSILTFVYLVLKEKINDPARRSA